MSDDTNRTGPADRDLPNGDEPPADDLTTFAALFAIDALDELERTRLLHAVSQVSAAEQADFHDEVAAVREATAELSETTATAPPAGLRSRLLAQLDGSEEATDNSVDRPDNAPEGRIVSINSQNGRSIFKRPRTIAAAAAAAAVLAIGGATIGYAIANQSAQTSDFGPDQIFAAPDVRTTSGPLAGGRATITYSPSSGQGMLVMNDVPQPKPGTIYQMWLVGPDGAQLAGTMSDADVAPSTTAAINNMHGATAVAFTVGDAATPDKMTSPPVAEFPLN